MNTFYVYFWGLICHVGERKNAETEKTHATLVRSDRDGMPPTHVRKLVFGRNDEVELGGNVSFRGASRARVENDFASYVVGLRDLIGQETDAKDSVYRKEPVEGYHCEYPRGLVALRVANLYRKLAVCVVDDVPKEFRIAARIVVAVVQTNDSELPFRYVNVDGEVVDDRLTTARPCLLVANAERIRDNASHASHYERLLVQPRRLKIYDDGAHEVQVDFIGDCGWVLDYINEAARQGIKAASSTECGNSSWP